MDGPISYQMFMPAGAGARGWVKLGWCLLLTSFLFGTGESGYQIDAGSRRGYPGLLPLSACLRVEIFAGSRGAGWLAVGSCGGRFSGGGHL